VGVAHQRAADALAAIMTERTGVGYVGVVGPEQETRDAEREARWQRRLAEMRVAGQNVDENGPRTD
jgi:hypothetical protein